MMYAIYTPVAQFGSVVQSCLTPCGPMDFSIPGLPVHHQHPKFTQTHVHRVGDAIQPSHPLLSPSPPAFILSQCQGLFKWVSSLHQVAKVLEFQLQHQSLQWTPRTDLLYDGLVGYPCRPGDSQESSPTPQFKSINTSGNIPGQILIQKDAYTPMFIEALFTIAQTWRGSPCGFNLHFLYCEPGWASFHIFKSLFTP